MGPFHADWSHCWCNVQKTKIEWNGETTTVTFNYSGVGKLYCFQSEVQNGAAVLIYQQSSKLVEWDDVRDQALICLQNSQNTPVESSVLRKEYQN